MGLFGIGKPKYDDAEIVAVATRSIEEDPVIGNPAGVTVSSKDGVVTLSGAGYTDTQVRHIADAVTSALRIANLKHAQIVNDLR